MAIALLLAVVGVANVLAQVSHGTSAFAYRGCSSVDLSCFGSPIVFSDGRVTPEACQAACQGHQFAALLPDACRCGDDENAITPVDESVCDHSCMGIAALGTCGSVCPNEGPGIANVYGRSSSSRQVPQPVTLSPISTLSLPSPAPDTSCSTSEQAPSANPSVATLVTPVGPAPEVPTSFPSRSPQVPAPPVPSFPRTSQTEAAPTSSCPLDDHSVSNVPTPPAQPPQAYPSEGTSEAPAYGTTAVPPSHTADGPSPPIYSPDGQSPPTPETYSGPGTPEDGSGLKPGTNCTISLGTEMSPYPSESTLWPSPSDRLDPKGPLPPGASHVPGSDSTCRLIPPFSTIGGLALIAAMIM